MKMPICQSNLCELVGCNHEELVIGATSYSANNYDGATRVEASKPSIIACKRPLELQDVPTKHERAPK